MAIQTNFPAIRPSLLLDFAKNKRLDSRITFTRTTTATYYDTGYTTVKAEENLLLQSQTFTAGTSWAATAISTTANTSTAPDGTTTATTITEDATANPHLTVNYSTSLGTGTYTMSIFAKLGTGSGFLTIGFNRAFNFYVSATFDLSAGTNTQTLISGYTNASATITAAAQGFYRCTVTATIDSAVDARVGLSSTSTHTSDSRGFKIYTGNGTNSLIIWGAQIEQRSSATPYIPTTTQSAATYTTIYSQTLRTAAAGQARFDHDPVTRESLGLLIEEQRTNLLTYSAGFDNAAWTKARSSITVNNIVAPDGTSTGDKLVEDTTASNTHFIEQTASVTNGTTYTFSVYAKAAERTFIVVQFNAGTTYSTRFDLSAGTVIAGGTGTASIQSVGNGWYRCSLSAASTATATGYFDLFLHDGSSGNYTGNGTSGIYIWGVQLEAGAFATSYIPTVAAQVTRNADVANIAGSNFTSWYNSAEGTLYCDWVKNGTLSFQTMAMISDGVNSPYNSISLLHGSGSPNNVRFDVNVNSASQASLTLVTGSVVGTAYKTIGVYKANDFAGVANAGTVQTDTSGNPPVVNQLGIGNNTIGGGYLNGTIKKLAYYPLRLTNAQLQALTS